jgi:hypothetical protein
MKPDKIKIQEIPVNIQEEMAIVNDITKTKGQRKEAYRAIRHKQLNPKETFDPETFDPFDDIPDADIRCRKREVPLERLETMGMKPKEIMVGQMIGMHESPQDLYLLIAHVNNKLLDRIEALEAQLKLPK